MLTVYEERGIEKGLIQGKQETLLRLLKTKFGDLPERIEIRVRQIAPTEELDLLSTRVLTANSLEEMGLDNV